MGLMMGASVITCLELLEYFVAYVLNSFRKHHSVTGIHGEPKNKNDLPATY